MNKLYLFVVASVIAVSGCGGGGGGSAVVGPKVLDGVFKDSNVQGLAYISGGQTGITDKKGAFKYEEDSQVAFSVAGVDMGTALGKAIVSPVDLVANGTLASDEVINRVRFLMMLDKDNEASNGIEISTAVQAAIQVLKAEEKVINFSSENFTSDPAVINLRVVTSSADTTTGNIVNHDFPTKEEAIAHLRTTLLCSFAGGFRGTYSGDENGNVAFMVDPATGSLTGSSYNSANQESVEINSTTPIDFDSDEKNFVSTEDSGKEFSGKFNSTEALGGEWKNTLSPEEKGDFSSTRIGGENNAVFRYTAAYTGDDKGLFTFDIDVNNAIKGVAYSVSSGDVTDLTGSVVLGERLKVDVKGPDDKLGITGFLNLEAGKINGAWEEDEKIGSYVGTGCKLN